MRSFLIATVFALFCSCADANIGKSKTPSGPPDLYYDLRQPIYLVVDESFWSGCEKDAVCRASRIRQIHGGIDEWIDYFDGASRPQVLIFSSEDKLPEEGVNKIIHMQLQPDICGKTALACWFAHTKPPKIVFAHQQWITAQIMAHEFGHVLGRDDNDVPEGTKSIMSYQTQKVVEPLDFEMMCKLHAECPAMKRK